MTSSNREIVEQVFQASAAKDWDRVKSFLHEDILVTEAESLPYRGEFRGPDAFIRLNQQVFDTWDDTQQQTDHVLVDGDHVVILGHFAGTGKKTGQAFSVPLAAVWRLEDGRVKEVRPFYFDTKLMHDAHYGG